MKNTTQNRIAAVRLSLASPERILEWSKGEITKPETINYKTQKPEKDGLFDEAIFGPVKDYECSCGRYKKVKNRGKICEKCNVEVIESIVRRERMGHIELAAPVAHIWMTKELPLPSKISLILNMSYRDVEQIVYFVNHVVLKVGEGKYKDAFVEKDVIDLSSTKAVKSSRGTLRKLMRMIEEDSEKGSNDYQRAKIYYENLNNSSLPFSFDEVANFIKRRTGIEIGTGAEAVLKLLQRVDLEEERNLIQDELKNVVSFEEDHSRKMLRRLEVINWFIESNNKPEWMILKRVPIIPPDLRPIIQLDGGKFTTSDLNNLYRRIIIRNERLKRILELNSPAIIVNNEKRLLQEAVDALFDNASRKKPVVGKDRRPLKSLTDYLKGKQGRFRQNLLGKRVDYSGRSVITIGPELKLYQCGIPAEMVLNLFKPFIIRELVRKWDEGVQIEPIAQNVKLADAMVQKQDPRIWPVVEKVMKERPVLLNRAPTLHRLGIQAFEPILIDGKAIRLHPLVTPAFNADFDGDQMAVHLPLSPEAVSEARSIMLASWNILGPKDGKPVVTPTQDIVLGLYYLTMESMNLKGHGSVFATLAELVSAYEGNIVDLHSIIGISTNLFPKKKFEKQGIILTTPGKVFLNEVLPDEMPFVNHVDQIGKQPTIHKGIEFKQALETHVPQAAFAKKHIAKIVSYLYQNFETRIVPKTMDGIKDLGFRFATVSGITVSAYDVPRYKKKETYNSDADKKVDKLQSLYHRGLLTNDERYTKVIKIWSDVRDAVSKDIRELIAQPEFKTNSIVIMSDSGARGNLSNFTQLSGMRGLMSKSFNYEQKTESKIIKDTIETPIKHSFIEGLTISEYFNSSYGARKGMSDTAMKTSKSGYMTRKLVDATQEVIVKQEDCGVKRGIVISDIVDTKTDVVIEKLSQRALDRFSMYDVVDPKSNKVIVKADQLIDQDVCDLIEKSDIKEIEVRSVMYCRSNQGVCQKCFGIDLTRRQPVEIGTNIGVIAAQSIGEPGTQLNMRTFHTGGVSGGSNIAQGFERLKQLLDVVAPKEWEQARISEIEGKVESISKDTEGYHIVIKNGHEQLSYFVDINSIFRVREGDMVKAGDKLVDGSIDIKKLLLVAGIDAVRQYMIKEVQKVYRSQGIEISDKYVEVIIRQLTNKLVIRDPGSTTFFSGEVVDIATFTKANSDALVGGKAPATAVNTIFGLSDAPSKSNSFLSAASFQDTKKVLIDASVKSEVDALSSLKENVILGQLIPSGSSLKTTEELLRDEQIAKSWLY